MEKDIEIAAGYLKSGNHAGAVSALQHVEGMDGALCLQESLAFLQDGRIHATSAYTQFVALKVIRFSLLRSHPAWLEQSDAILSLLLGYAYAVGERLVTGEWRPVLTEATLTVAVLLKLMCVRNGDVDAASVGRGLSGTLSLLTQQPTTPTHACIHRTLCQRVVEEFGLFEPASRYRGLPIRVHRQSRLLFEAAGGVYNVIKALLSTLGRGTAAETAASAEAGVSLLYATLSWASYRFFEETALPEESCDEFDVTAAEWNELLLSAEGDARGLSLVRCLAEWFASGSVAGVPVSRQRVGDMMQMVCSFTSAGWSDQQHQQFLFPSLFACLHMMDQVMATPTDDFMPAFPALANGVRRLVANHADALFQIGDHAHLHRLRDVTKSLIVYESSSEGDEHAMSSLEEMLSMWYSLATYVNRLGYGDQSSAAAAAACSGVVRTCGADILESFLNSKISAAISDVEDDFSDAFTASHLHLVAELGRMSSGHACKMLAAALQHLEKAIRSTPGEGAYRFYDGLWTALSIIRFFVADPNDGEEAYIPLCFVDAASAGDDQVVQLMHAVLGLAPLVFSEAVTSPAILCAFVDLVTRYIASYVEATESPALYRSAFNGGADVVSFALQLATDGLKRFPFEVDCCRSICDMLDCISEKSDAVRSFALVHPSMATLTQYASNLVQFQFYRRTRGRLVAFLLMCAPCDVDQATAAQRLQFLSAKMDSVNILLDCVCTFTGLHESLKRQDIILCCFPLLLQSGYDIVRLCFQQSNERELVLEAVAVARTMLAACGPFLPREETKGLLHFVEHVLLGSQNAMTSSSTWHSAEGADDRVLLLKAQAHLVTGISRWKYLECSIPAEDLVSISEAVVATLAAILGSLDANFLALPDVEEAAFQALERCSEAFTDHFLSPAHLPKFFPPILYALQTEKASIQRIGVAVTETVAVELPSRQREDYSAVYSGLLQVLLKSLVAGKVHFSNTGPVARAIAVASHGLPPNVTGQIFQSVLDEVPMGKSFLEALFSALTQASSSGLSDAAVKQFGATLQDCLASVHGISII